MFMVPDQICVVEFFGGGDNPPSSSGSTSFNLEDAFESSDDRLGMSSASWIRGGVGIVTVDVGTS